MLNIFGGLFDSTYTTVISVSDFLICIASALIIGLVLAFFYQLHARDTKGFIAEIALLPAVVCVVIMMVNGNVGTGVAVAGAFSLVRFRSAAGSAKQIGAIFLAMATGLMVGTGYIGFAALTAIVLSLASLLYNSFDFGMSRKNALYKTMNITIPEDLDYTDVFDDILKTYTTSYEIVQVKTTNMGSLYKLTYDLVLKNTSIEKQLIDELRVRNGNLEISMSRQQNIVNEL